MGTPLSCLLILPVEDLAAYGLSNFHDPVVKVAFKAKSDGLYFDFGLTTPPREVLEEWVYELTPDHAEVITSHNLFLQLSGQGRLVTENNQPITDERVLACAEWWFERMGAWRAILLRVPGNLPELDALRTDLEGYLRARIQLALETEPSKLDGAHWMVQHLCEDHHPAITEYADRALFARTKGEHSPLVTTISAASQRTVFAVPRVTNRSCSVDRTANQAFHDLLLGLCEDELVKELIPSLYAELVPQARPAPGILPQVEILDLDLLGALGEP